MHQELVTIYDMQRDGIVGVVIVLALGAVGCGATPQRESPQAEKTRTYVQAMIDSGDGEFQRAAADGGVPPGKVSRVDCGSGTNADRDDDYKCTALTDTGLQVECFGVVNDGRIVESGCSPPIVKKR